MICIWLTTGDAYNEISNPVELNPAVFNAKIQRFFEYSDSK